MNSFCCLPIKADIGSATEAIGAVHDAGVVAMAVGAAQIFLGAFPAAAAEDAIDPLGRAFGIIGLLDGVVVEVIIVPVLAPFVDVACHVV